MLRLPDPVIAALVALAFLIALGLAGAEDHRDAGGIPQPTTRGTK